MTKPVMRQRKPGAPASQHGLSMVSTSPSLFPALKSYVTYIMGDRLDLSRTRVLLTLLDASIITLFEKYLYRGLVL